MHGNLDLNGNEEQRQRVGAGISVRTWLLLAIAALLIFVIVNNVVLARGPGAGPGSILGGGSCCAPAAASGSEGEIKQKGLLYYYDNYGEEAVDAELKDFGCHQEIYIYRDGQLRHRLAYISGSIYDLGPVGVSPGVNR